MRLTIWILAAFLLLGSASVAVAECAWVLWSEKTHQNSTEWKLQSASETLKDCQATRHKIWNEILNEYSDPGLHPEIERVKKVPFERLAITKKPDGSSSSRFVILDEAGNPVEYTEEEKRKSEQRDRVRRTSRYRFLCLPDTIDPREK